MPARCSSARRRRSRAAAALKTAATAPKSAHFDAGVEASKLMPLQEVVKAARAAKAHGATRFCMGAAWRSPKARDIERVSEMVLEVEALGLKTCMAPGMIDAEQSQSLDDAGLDGTPLAGTKPLDPFEFVRTIAVARITMPKTMVRLSAGRKQMDDALQEPVLRGRCQLHLLRRPPAHHVQPAGCARRGIVRSTRLAAMT